MQTCFFALARILPLDESIAHIKQAIQKTYGKRGEVVVQRNCDAVDRAIEAMHKIELPEAATSETHRRPPVPENSPDFVKRVTGLMLAGLGDLLPVSALPVDGTFPTGTAAFGKRGIAHCIPIWDPDICIQCGLCSLVCPHAAIRSKAFPKDSVNGNAPDSFQTL